MSNITKEFAQDIIRGHGYGVAPSAVEALARIALASLEAEPAGVVRHIELRGPEHPAGIHVSLYSRLDDGIELYTAQPAPVSVPDFGALTKCIVQRLVDYGATDDDAIARAEEFVYNTCRAAMLQGAENAESRCSNSPVIADGWVACSERMPDPDSKFRICVYTPTPHEDVRFRFVPASLFKSVCRDATHWKYMLPPAAPQQEVK